MAPKTAAITTDNLAASLGMILHLITSGRAERPVEVHRHEWRSSFEASASHDLTGFPREQEDPLEDLRAIGRWLYRRAQPELDRTPQLRPVKLTLSNLAERVGISVGTLRTACVGSRVERPKNGQRDFEFTAGQVERIAKLGRQPKLKDRGDEWQKWNDLLTELGRPGMTDPLRADKRA